MNIPNYSADNEKIDEEENSAHPQYPSNPADKSLDLDTAYGSLPLSIETDEIDAVIAESKHEHMLASQDRRRVADLFGRLQKGCAFSEIEGPVAWQREMRKDRPLPRRDTHK